MPPNQHILFAFLKHLEVPFTESYLSKLTTGIPYSETIVGMSRILSEKYHLECACLRIEKDDIFKLDTPFIVQLRAPRNAIVLVTNVKHNQVSLLYKSETSVHSMDEFFASWEGIVLLAAPINGTGEEGYWQNLRIDLLNNFRIPVIIVASVISLLYLTMGALANLFLAGWMAITIWIFYVFGIVLSALLLSQSINKSDSLVEKVCKSGRKNGCAKILDGNASKVLGLISWSEVGFVYFIGSALVLLLFKECIGILFLMSIAALPYTFWSIYYQWRIAKEWCPFCVSIQGIIWITVALYLINLSSLSFPTSVDQIIYLLSCFLAPSLILGLVVPFAKSHQELRALKISYNSLKFSEPVFTATMKTSASVDITDASSIIFGNPNSKFVVTVATSFYCGHCVEVNKFLGEFLNRYRDKVCVQVVFKVPTPPIEDNLGIKHVIGVYKSYDRATAEVAYHKMYEVGVNDIKRFIELYPVPENVQNVDQEIEKHIKWFINSEIIATPTVFLNQKLLPRWYSISDLEHLFMMTSLT